MASSQTRCDGVFIGHAIASQFDASVQMALQLSGSLLELKRFEGSDVMSRYLYLYHTKRYKMGEITIATYQNLKDIIKNSSGHSPVCREDFVFDQSIINETVKLTDDKFGGLTGGCGPVHRSFPLALCPYIIDDELFDITMKEAALTHYSRVAGQVAGIVNLICRSLLRNKKWHEAVQSAFSAPSLHADVNDVCIGYGRRWSLSKTTHPAYAPTALSAALHAISISKSAAEAIQQASVEGNHYCLPIVGILSGALWSIPTEMYKDKANDLQLKTIRDTAHKVSNQWTSQSDSVNA
jgi:ADP-ribosylglycohydrolase